MGAAMDDFKAPDWNSPIDLPQVLASAPPSSTVKGVFFRTAIQVAQARAGQAPVTKSYGALSSYPITELIQVLADCARAAYPGLPLRKALRLVGHEVFPGIRATTLGSFLLGVTGKDLLAAFSLVRRVYKTFSSGAIADLEPDSPTHVIVKLRSVWTFADSYHVGIFEGAVKSYGKQPLVTIRPHSPCDVDLSIFFA